MATLQSAQNRLSYVRPLSLITRNDHHPVCHCQLLNSETPSLAKPPSYATLDFRLKVTGKLEEDRIRFLGKVIDKEEDGTIALYMEKDDYEGMMNLYPGGKSSDPQFVSAL